MGDIEIGARGSSVLWTDDPVDIACEANDTFDVLLRHSCTIRLATTRFIGDLFRTSWDQSTVNILRDGQLLFAGYIEPQTYSQPYNEREDDLELNCVDALSALQYNKYCNAG